MDGDIIGFVAAILTTSAFVPQAVKAWKTRSTDDLSPLMYALFCIGISCWLIYGIIKHDVPIILANAVTLIFAGSIMYFIIIRKKTRKIAHIGLYVNDLEGVRKFYIGHFSAVSGPKYTNEAKQFTSYFLTFSSGPTLELMHSNEIAGLRGDCNWGHIAFNVGSEKAVDAFSQRLEKEGISILCKPRKTGDGFYESVISDPEGNRIEITC